MNGITEVDVKNECCSVTASLLSMRTVYSFDENRRLGFREVTSGNLLQAAGCVSRQSGDHLLRGVPMVARGATSFALLPLHCSPPPFHFLFKQHLSSLNQNSCTLPLPLTPSVKITAPYFWAEIPPTPCPPPPLQRLNPLSVCLWCSLNYSVERSWRTTQTHLWDTWVNRS